MDGYMISVDANPERLIVHGKNKPARIALAGEGHGDGDVVIRRADITGIDYKPTRMMGAVNGNLTIMAAGRKYQLHFLKKHQAGFEALAQDLRGTV